MRAAFAALLALACAACGVGGALTGTAGGGGGGGSPPRVPPPTVTLSVSSAVTVDGEKTSSGYVRLEIVLADPAVGVGDDRTAGAADPRVRIYPEFASDDATSQWAPMTEAALGASEGRRGLALGTRRFVWDTLTDIGGRRRVAAIRVRAEYEDPARRGRRFRGSTDRLIVNNLTTTTVLGGDVEEPLDFVTSPADLCADGDGFLVASVGANIVERVDAAGGVARVAGLGLPGSDVTAGRGRGVARLPAVSGVALGPHGSIVTSHDAGLVVTNREPAPLAVGGLVVGPGTVERFAPGSEEARTVRSHPSGALVWIEGAGTGSRIVAWNPAVATEPDAATLVLGGVPVAAGEIATIAGGGTSDAEGAHALDAEFAGATALAVGPDGEIYVAERERYRVRVVNPGTTSLDLAVGRVDPGAVQTVAGGGVAGSGGDGGPATAARFQLLAGIHVTSARALLIVDAPDARPRVRLANLGPSDATIAGTLVRSGEIDTVVGGGAVAAGAAAREVKLEAPRAVGEDAAGRILVSDGTKVLLVNPGTGSVDAYGRRVAGGRTALVYDAAARGGLPLQRPSALQLQFVRANQVLATDATTVRVLNLDRRPAVLGGAAAAPGRSAVLAGGAVAGYSGDGGPSREAAFDAPGALAVFPALNKSDASPLVFVADTGNDRVRVIHVGDAADGGEETAFGVTVAAGNVDTVAGGGAAPAAQDGDGGSPRDAVLDRPAGLAVLRVRGRDVLVVADTGHHRIRALNPGPGDLVLGGVTIAEGSVGTLVGDGTPGFTPDGPGPGRTHSPGALTALGSLLVFAEPGNARIRAINYGDADVTIALVTLPPGEIRTLVGTGARGMAGDGDLGPQVDIDSPAGLFLQTRNGEPNALYFSDGPQNVVRVLNLTNDEDLDVAVDLRGNAVERFAAGTVATVAGGPNRPGVPNPPSFGGDGALPSEMRLAAPAGIAWMTREQGPFQFAICDSDNDRVRVTGPPPTRSVFAGP